MGHYNNRSQAINRTSSLPYASESEPDWGINWNYAPPPCPVSIISEGIKGFWPEKIFQIQSQLNAPFHTISARMRDQMPETLMLYVSYYPTNVFHDCGKWQGPLYYMILGPIPSSSYCIVCWIRVWQDQLWSSQWNLERLACLII